MKQEKTPAQMFEERQLAIKNRISDKDIKTGIGWAVNNAVQIMIAMDEKDFSDLAIKRYAKRFQGLAKEMYQDEINRISREYEMEEKHFEARDFESNAPIDISK